ncbi:D-hexose-6-phosphate mutarotase [Bifidobacterium simiarum]|uniref:Putative glucose-6-phosphate 1-epimerase n=1 Tax=Bifidobacterium simiarum TaxID=2045441 RepID=A0A2M9HCL7_9BIFI|nr:D-hexose-6-phosphate mutarotase [Bifidobacterium simiarum]PJM74532.1 D-hexose-6-phosphate mutarotase [Bifidobacterium simiarum]
MSDQFIIRTLDGEGGSATISDYGAHVLRWAPAGQPDVVWQPSAVYLSEGTAIRGGVPIVFPWFNSGYDPEPDGTDNGRTASRTPKHGFARTSFWHRDESASAIDGDGNAVARYTLDSTEADEATLAQFVGNPHPRFHAVYEVRSGSTLTMAFTVTNDGNAPFSYETALHTYLHVGDVEHVEVTGLDGTEYLDTTVSGFPVCAQHGPIRFDGSMVDRIYLSDHEIEVHDERLDRTIVATSHGANTTVVWNPGESAGNAIGDLADGEWRGFVCVEAAANRANLITLNPGESHTIAQTLSVLQKL